MAKKSATTLAGKSLVQVLRVSRVNGRSGSSFMSPDEQRDANEAFCARESAEIVTTVDETDSVSGGSMEREGLQYAVSLCNDGLADGIIVAKLDRFSRTLQGGLKVITDLEDRGHLLLSAREGVIVGDERAAATDKLMRHFFLMLAQWQRDTLAESWEATRERHIANKVANVIPYGYMRNEDRQLIPHPDEADFVKDMFQMRADGKGWVSIATALNDAGAKPRRAAKFTHARISGIVANRVYLGELRSGEFVNEHAHDPLVTKAVWERANGTRTLRSPSEDAQISLLAGIVRCASCGQKMRCERRGSYRYYRCRVRHGWGSCPEPVSVPADALDALVEARFAADYFGLHTNQPAALDDAVEAATAVLEGAEAELEAYVTVMSARDPSYRKGYDKRSQDIQGARQALTAAQNAARGFALPSGLADDWPQMSDEDRRSFLADAFEMVAVRPGRGWREDVGARSHIWGRGEIATPALAFSPIVWSETPGEAGVAVA